MIVYTVFQVGEGYAQQISQILKDKATLYIGSKVQCSARKYDWKHTPNQNVFYRHKINNDVMTEVNPDQIITEEPSPKAVEFIISIPNTFQGIIWIRPKDLAQLFTIQCRRNVKYSSISINYPRGTGKTLST